MRLNSVYVTVGTTSFDALIQRLFSEEVLNVLQERGCQKLIIQYGNGVIPPVHKAEDRGINVEIYQFKFGPERVDIINTDLTIGHAGAGTCMDILKNKKPGLVVINEDLMDNHQTELAEQLAKDGHIFRCTVNTLAKSIKTVDFESFVAYESGMGMRSFIQHLKTLM